MVMNIDKCRELQAEVYNRRDKEVREREELRSNIQIQGNDSCNGQFQYGLYDWRRRFWKSLQRIP